MAFVTIHHSHYTTKVLTYGFCHNTPFTLYNQSAYPRLLSLHHSHYTTKVLTHGFCHNSPLSLYNQSAYPRLLSHYTPRIIQPKCLPMAFVTIHHLHYTTKVLTHGFCHITPLALYNQSAYPWLQAVHPSGLLVVVPVACPARPAMPAYTTQGGWTGSHWSAQTPLADQYPQSVRKQRYCMEKNCRAQISSTNQTYINTRFQ